MRGRIHLRDILWYRTPTVGGDGRVMEAHAMRHTSSADASTAAIHNVPSSDHSPVLSPLDVWRRKFKTALGMRSNSTSTVQSTDSASRSHLLLHKLGVYSLRQKFNSSSEIRSAESARDARLDASGDRGQGWPGLSSTLAERSIAGRYDGWHPNDNNNKVQAVNEISVTRDRISSLEEPSRAHFWGTRSTAETGINSGPV